MSKFGLADAAAGRSSLIPAVPDPQCLVGSCLPILRSERQALQLVDCQRDDPAAPTNSTKKRSNNLNSWELGKRLAAAAVQDVMTTDWGCTYRLERTLGGRSEIRIDNSPDGGNHPGSLCGGGSEHLLTTPHPQSNGV